MVVRHWHNECKFFITWERILFRSFVDFVRVFRCEIPWPETAAVRMWTMRRWRIDYIWRFYHRWLVGVKDELGSLLTYLMFSSLFLLHTAGASSINKYFVTNSSTNERHPPIAAYPMRVFTSRFDVFQPKILGDFSFCSSCSLMSNVRNCHEWMQMTQLWTGAPTSGSVT